MQEPGAHCLELRTRGRLNIACNFRLCEEQERLRQERNF